jgi:hypothetical protein
MTEAAMRAALAAGLIALFGASQALAQSPTEGPKPKAEASGSMGGSMGADQVGGWPKISFDTLASLEFAGMRAPSGPGRGPDVNLRSDSTLLVEFDDALSLDACSRSSRARPCRPRTPTGTCSSTRALGATRGVSSRNSTSATATTASASSFRTSAAPTPFSPPPSPPTSSKSRKRVTSPPT